MKKAQRLFYYLMDLFKNIKGTAVFPERNSGKSALIFNFSTTPICIYVILLFANCSIYDAYKYNQLGLKAYEQKDRENSIGNFERSISYSFRQHIPTYNIGNIFLSEEDFAAAHEKFQKSIQLDPDFIPAIYNDGQTLYHWAKKEIDPKTCNLGRAKEFLFQSKSRFMEVVSSKNSEYQVLAEKNIQEIDKELAKLDRMEKSNCKDNQEQKSEDEKSESNNQNSENQKNENNQNNSQSKEENEKNKNNSQSKEENEKNKNNSQSKEENEKNKNNSQSKEENEKNKNNSQSKEENEKNKNNSQSKEENEKNQNNSQSNNQNEGKNESEGGNGTEKSPGRPQLTQEEKKQIQEQLADIKKRANESKSFKKAKEQQEKSRSNAEWEELLKETLP